MIKKCVNVKKLLQDVGFDRHLMFETVFKLKSKGGQEVRIKICENPLKHALGLPPPPPFSLLMVLHILPSLFRSLVKFSENSLKKRLTFLKKSPYWARHESL